ncbi:MAG: MFS transporter, partial [Candidatus Marinimicrobia bacterium]|nr:MFS transporter [Candidatus Neomarinimicrobiota bacterium]
MIRKVIDIRDDEIATSMLMFFYFFAIIASYYILKPVRNSLFLEQLGAINLPWVYIGTASIIGFIVLLYSNLSRHIDTRYLVSGTIIFFILNLIFFRELFKLNLDWFSALFYIWVSVYSVLLISQFWMTANIIYSASQAKRLFGFIGSGGILGGIIGGGLTTSIATSIGT